MTEGMVPLSLNIKNQHVHDLAREAARRTGKSQTSVIETALSRLLADLDRGSVQEREQALLEIAGDFQSRLTDEEQAQMTTDWLYDDQGLPA